MVWIHEKMAIIGAMSLSSLSTVISDRRFNQSASVRLLMLKPNSISICANLAFCAEKKKKSLVAARPMRRRVKPRMMTIIFSYSKHRDQAQQIWSMPHTQRIRRGPPFAILVFNFVRHIPIIYILIQSSFYIDAKRDDLGNRYWILSSTIILTISV